MTNLIAASDWTVFLGRFHPLVVHLPIGFLAGLAVLELADRVRHFKHASQARGIMLGCTAGSAVVAVVLGLMLEESGGYDAQLLAWHKWFGIGLAGLCVLTAGAYWGRWHRPYVGLLMLTLLVLGPASHFGGSMTHGRDYLTAHAPGWVKRLVGEKAVAVAAVEEKRITDVGEARVWEDVVRPVLENKCVSCHGAEKMKGELRVDTLELVHKGGKSGAGVVAGRVAESPVVARVMLAEEDLRHMPPAGKPQLTDEEMAVLTWWVEAGAVGDKKVGEMEVPLAVGDAIAGVLGIEVERPAGPLGWEEIAGEVAKLNALPGLVVTRVDPERAVLNVNTATARTFGDEDLKRLEPVARNIAWLNLAGTKVTDEGMSVVGGMHNLERLRLERTGVTDVGLEKISKLRKLEYLNLYGTQVSDGGVGVLKGLPGLRQVYLWRTKVSEEGAKALAEAKTNRAKIERLRKEMARLEGEIAAQQVVVEGGVKPVVAVAATQPGKAEEKQGAEVAVVNAAGAAPAIINTVCPVSGNPVDATKFVDYKGRRIGFCCGNCPKEFEKVPGKYEGKVVVVGK